MREKLRIPMRPSTFLVTGWGRSGTKFLAALANKSRRWAVGHEPDGQKDAAWMQGVKKGKIPPTPLASTVARFERDYYGEVNSRLRLVLFKIPVATRAIVLRDPKEIALSAANRRPDIDATRRSVVEMYHYYREVHALGYAISGGAGNFAFVDFHRMTTDIAYTQRLLEYLGIIDVLVTEGDIATPVNATRQHKYATFDDLPEEIRTIANCIPYDRSLLQHTPI